MVLVVLRCEAEGMSKLISKQASKVTVLTRWTRDNVEFALWMVACLTDGPTGLEDGSVGGQG